jgi:serine/threonine-protein kinase
MAAVESRAALILGPIAHHLVGTVAAKASTPRELATALAAFMPASGEREDFLRSCAATSSGPEAATPATRFVPSSSAFSADVLERAGRRLATYVGPMASILVSRAAAKAVSEDELYDLLAAEIVSPKDREAFRRTRSPSQPRRR